MSSVDKLSDFASLIKKANEDKRIKEEAEKQRKLVEVSPMLDDFAAIIKKATEAKKLKAESANTVLEAKKAPRSDLNGAVVPTYQEPAKIAPQPVLEPSSDTEEDIQTLDPKIYGNIEKKFLKMFNRLQNDFQTLKKTVAQQPVGFGGAGSGEVRILRMDDVDARNIVDNSVLVYDAATKKFLPVPISSLGTGSTPTTTDEEMPYAKRTDFISDNELYKGEASVGSPDGNPVWRIRKVVIGNDGDVTETWANGNAEYTNRWTDRLTLTYS